MVKLPPVPRQLRTRNIFIPIILGLGVAGWLMYNDFDQQSYSSISWTGHTFFWLFMCLMMMAVRDLGYMVRIRILTEKSLSWRQSFDVIMLWEFASALTPSVVGGSGIAMFIMHREKIALGRSTAIVMVTALLDELFYILLVPLCVLAVGFDNLFPVELEKQFFGISFGIKGIFYLGYIFIFLLTTVILLSVIFFPRGFKNVLVNIFSLPFLKRWRKGAYNVGEEVVITSRELRGKKFNFWWKSFLATLFSWSARFLVINCLILAFAPVEFSEHVVIYARQMVMWVIMLISPTPGSSGVAEFVFKGFLSDFTPANLAGFQAFLWRILSYYPYLIIGVIILPRWWKKTSAYKQ